MLGERGCALALKPPDFISYIKSGLLWQVQQPGADTQGAISLSGEDVVQTLRWLEQHESEILLSHLEAHAVPTAMMWVRHNVTHTD